MRTVLPAYFDRRILLQPLHRVRKQYSFLTGTTMPLPYENSTSGELMVQFEYRGQMVSVKASFNGYAAAWLKEHPYSSRMRCTKTEHERKAKDIAGIAVYSILRDWIKGQILLPSGQTILEHAQQSHLLPALEQK
jgi:hypothetical protein